MSDGQEASGSEVRSPDLSKRKKRPSLPKEATDYLKQWMRVNRHHPYPDEKTKIAIAERYHLTVVQVNNFLINSRRRYFKKEFPEHDRNPVFIPKRGARKSAKRRKVEKEYENYSSSSEESLPPRKVLRTTPLLCLEDLSPVESTDSERYNAMPLKNENSYYNVVILNHDYGNLVMLTELACQMARQK